MAALLGTLIVAACLFLAFRQFRKKRLIDDLPTSKTQSVFIGLTELKGTAESESPFSSYLSGTACVQYAWHIEEHWSRTVSESYRDARGNMQMRTRTESGWNKVASGGQSGPFFLKDDTGVIRILPEGAALTGKTTFDQTQGRDSPLYFGKGPANEIANTTHKRRFLETSIPLHASLYVMGQARERNDLVAAEVAHDPRCPLFLISVKTEKQLSNSYGLWFGLLALLAFLAALGSALVWNLLQIPEAKAGIQPFLWAAGGFLFLLLLGWVWTVYNSLIGLHHRVEQGWSQVEVELKRRSDLIPNLVQAVEGYRVHESQTQQLLAEMRSQTAAAHGLKAVAEAYPELGASELFMALQKSLGETEQRIALARDYYNQITTFYNTRLGIIPDRLVAALARLKERSLMMATGFERAPVKVQLVD